jgi:putative peptidoglycan lipid II flippase
MKGSALAAIVSLQLLATFASQLIIIRQIGLGPDTDSFFAAQAVPVVLSTVLHSTLQSVWLPRLSASSREGDKWRVTLEIALGQASLLGLGVFGLFSVTATFWMPVLYPAFTEQQTDNVIKYFYILSGASIFTVLSTQLTLALRTKERFLAVEILNLTAITISLGLIYWFASVGGLMAVTLVMLGRSILIYALQLRMANWPVPAFARGWSSRDAWGLMVPTFAGATLYKAAPLVDRYWASYAPAGGLTIFHLAQTAVGALSTVIERSICAPIMARFGSYTTGSDYKTLKAEYRRGIVKVTLVSALYCLIMVVLEQPFVYFVESLLEVPNASANDLWWLSLLLVGYLHVAASGTLPVAVLHALGDTKSPVVIGVVGLILGLLLKSIGFVLYGLQGLVLATSMYYVVNMATMIFFCENKLNEKCSRVCGT